MGAESVLVLLLVCVFTAAEGFLNIKCDEVTGHVGDKLALTCRVSYEDNKSCMTVYKFMNKDKDTTICRENFTSVPCIQLTSFSCPYTANEAMTSTFKFFIQTPHVAKSAEFTVNIAEALKGDQTAAKIVPTEDPPGKTDNTVLVVTGLVICLVVVVAVGLILKRRYNRTNILQRGYDLGEREENNINEPKNTEEV